MNAFGSAHSHGKAARGAQINALGIGQIQHGNVLLHSHSFQFHDKFLVNRHLPVIVECDLPADRAVFDIQAFHLQKVGHILGQALAAVALRDPLVENHSPDIQHVDDAAVPDKR